MSEITDKYLKDENGLVEGFSRLSNAGCKIVQDTGECIGCIELEEPIIKEEKVILEKKPVVKVSYPPLYPRVNESLRNKVKTKKKKWVCYVILCSWLQPPTKVSQSKDRKPIKRERNWVGTPFECIVGYEENVKYWDEGGNEFDKNLNLISTN